MNNLISILIWIVFGILSLLLFFIDLLVWALTFWWDKRLWVLHRYSAYWSMLYIWLNPLWRIQMFGKENIKKNKAYVIVSNHQSALDILLLYRLFTHFKWVAKKELFRVPVVGWNLWLNRYITVDRKNPKDALRMIQQGLAHLRMGSSVLLFAEGTRTLDGKVRRFKEGAFLLAKKANVPILPVVIDGTLEALPKNGFAIRGRHTFKIHILPEISAEFVGQMEPAEMAKHVNQIILEKHKEVAPKFYREGNN